MGQAFASVSKHGGEQMDGFRGRRLIAVGFRDTGRRPREVAPTLSRGLQPPGKSGIVLGLGVQGWIIAAVSGLEWRSLETVGQ